MRLGNLIIKALEVSPLGGTFKAAHGEDAFQWWRAIRAYRYYVRREHLNEIEAARKAATLYGVDVVALRAKLGL